MVNSTQPARPRIVAIALACALPCLSLTGPLTPVALAKAPGGSMPPRSSLLAADDAGGSDAATRFRQQFGLRADRDYVDSSTRDSKSFPNLDWGIPLSEDEAADLQSRLSIQDGLRDAIEFAAAEPSYAGTYLDQLRGGLPVFLFTDVAATDRVQLAAKIKVPTEIAIAPAKWTLEELMATKRTVAKSRESLRTAGVNVTSVSIDIEANVVEVSVIDADSRAEAAISELAPGTVVVDGTLPLADACSITSCLPPTGIIGGLEIVQTGSSICTSGYVGRRADVSGSPKVLVTAGHCIRGGALAWHHAGTTIGTAFTTNGWYDGSWADVGAILLDSDSKPTTYDQNLYNPDTGKLVTWSGFGDETVQIQGAQVCRIGWGSWSTNHDASDPLRNHYTGLQCGTITRYDTDSDGTTDGNSKSCVGSTCHWISHMKIVSFDSTGGDSGGTIFAPTTGTTTKIYGTHVHSQADSSTSNRGWYSPYYWGRNQFAQHQGTEIYVCLTASCT
jgi:hypothetical protein